MRCDCYHRGGGNGSVDHCSFVYSALACFRMGMSGSASFQMFNGTVKSKGRQIHSAETCGSLARSSGRNLSATKRPSSVSSAL